jgi:hypothetical protein
MKLHSIVVAEMLFHPTQGATKVRSNGGITCKVGKEKEA